MRKAEFERSFRKEKEDSRKVRKICCVVVSLRERRLRKQKESATPRLLKGKTTNKARARIYALYIWIRYTVCFILRRKLPRRTGEKRKNVFWYNDSGDNGRKDPPVPIPNTEVKLSYAESTQRDTAREDRSSPLLSFPIVVNKNSDRYIAP